MRQAWLINVQQRLGGEDYIPETPTGNSLDHLQWWFAEKLQTLTRMELT